jgi:hypothetical protein
MNEIDMRTLTFVIYFDQSRKPAWLWENHMNQTYKHGILISAIAEGDRLSGEFCGEDE